MSTGDLFAILAAVFWSVCVILMRISGFRIRPVALTLFKTAAAVPMFAVLMLVLVVVRGDPLLPELSPLDHLRLVLSAVLGVTIADTMFAAALNRLGASLQALADCIYAPSVAAVGFLMFGERLGPWELAGGSLVVAGIAVGMRPTEETPELRDLLSGAALAAGAHLIMAVGILMVRDLFSANSVVWVSGYRFAIAAFSLAGLALLRAPAREVFEGFRRTETWRLMIPMTFFGPFLATLFWTAGFKHIAAGRAAIYNQLSTPFIIVLASLVLHERMTRRKLVGVALAAAGAVLVGTRG